MAFWGTCKCGQWRQELAWYSVGDWLGGLLEICAYSSSLMLFTNRLHPTSTHPNSCLPAIHDVTRAVRGFGAVPLPRSCPGNVGLPISPITD